MRSRAINPDCAHDAGCRTVSRDVMVDLYRQHGEQTLVDAGLLRPATETKDVRAAWKWESDPAPRLWIPVFSPEWPDAPVSYKWRAVWPGQKAGKTIFPTQLPWRSWPLGARWACDLWYGDRSPGATVVICEGEPDWLTLAFQLEPGAHVFGIGTGGWQDHWNRLLEGAPAIIVSMHDDDAGRAATEKVGKAIGRLWPDESVRPANATYPPPTGGDWNDVAQTGSRARALVETVKQVIRDNPTPLVEDEC